MGGKFIYHHVIKVLASCSNNLDDAQFFAQNEPRVQRMDHGLNKRPCPDSNRGLSISNRLVCPLTYRANTDTLPAHGPSFLQHESGVKIEQPRPDSNRDKSFSRRLSYPLDHEAKSNTPDSFSNNGPRAGKSCGDSFS